MKTIIKYLIIGFIISFLTYKIPLLFISTDQVLKGIAVIGASIVLTIVICTGIIVHHIRDTGRYDTDDFPTDN